MKEFLLRNGQGELYDEQLGVDLIVDDTWVLTKHLGSGGFGHVYEGWHRKLDVFFALKFLDAAHWSEQAKAQFLAEARVMSHLHDDSLVRVTHYGALPSGMPYFVMERLWGKTLRERLSTESPLPIAEAVEIAAGLLEGLSHVHSHGLVHGDIKPENTFLSLKGTRVRLLDFGLAKTSALTSTGGIGGTPPYMAPEVLLEGRPPDVASDVYAVGVILYEMLAGRLPRGHLRMDLEQARQAWSEGTVPSVRIHRAEVPETLARLLDETLARDPRLRPETAAAMLERLLASELDVPHETHLGAPLPLSLAPKLPSEIPLDFTPIESTSGTAGASTESGPVNTDSHHREQPRVRVVTMISLSVLVLSLLCFSVWRWAWPWSVSFEPANNGLLVVAPFWADEQVDVVFDATCDALDGKRPRPPDVPLPVHCTRVSAWQAAHERLTAAADVAGVRAVVVIDEDGITIRSTSHNRGLPLLAALDGLELAGEASMASHAAPLLRAIADPSHADPSVVPVLEVGEVGPRWAVVAEAMRQAVGAEDARTHIRREELARCADDSFYCSLAKLVYATTSSTGCENAERYLREVTGHPRLQVQAMLERAACRVNASASAQAVSEAESLLDEAFRALPDDPCVRVAAIGTVARIGMFGGDASGTLRQATSLSRSERRECLPRMQAIAFGIRGHALVEQERWCPAADAYHEAFNVWPDDAKAMLDWAETSLRCEPTTGEHRSTLLAALKLDPYSDLHTRISIAYLRWLITHERVDATMVARLHADVRVDEVALLDGVAGLLREQICASPAEPCSYELLSQPKREGDVALLQRSLGIR